MGLSEAILKEADRGHIAFIPFTILGYPQLEISQLCVEILNELHVTAYETAIPVPGGWSDDTNATIIRAHLQALRHGVDEQNVLSYYRNFRPNLYILYLYTARPSISSALRRINSYIDAVLPEWDPPGYSRLRHEALKNGIELVNFVSPTMDRAEIRRRARRSALVYLAAAPRTGSKLYRKRTIEKAAAEIKQAANVPVCCGFGIKTPSDVSALVAIPQCDGVIVGTAILQAMSKGTEEFRQFVSQLMEATQR